MLQTELVIYTNSIKPDSPPRKLNRFFERLAQGDRSLARTLLVFATPTGQVERRILCVPEPNVVRVGDELPGEVLSVEQIRQMLR